MTSDDGFDPADPPVIVYCISDTDRPDAVCTWRWWGPSPAWDVLGWIVRLDHDLVLERVAVVPYGSFGGDEGDVDEDGELTPVSTSLPPSALRQIPLARLMAQVHGDLLKRAPSAPRGEQWAEHVLALAGPAAPDEGRRRRGPTDELLRQVAEWYLEEAQGGRGLWARVAGRLDLSEDRVRELIRAARERGYLTSAEAGKREARPGPRLLDELYRDEVWAGTTFEYSSAAERDEAHRRSREHWAQNPPDVEQPPF